MTETTPGWLRRLFPTQPHVRAQDKIYGALGAFLGIISLVGLTRYFTPSVSPSIVASMGASAVLLFAAPHSPLAQPWPFIGGNLLSALTGVCCQKWLDDPFMAAAAAVSLSILLMHFLDCLHPPGGATALFAVTGGDAVHDLGFSYVLTPVGVNVLAFLILAMLINNLLIPRRTYPATLSQPPKLKPALNGASIQHSDIEAALREMDSYIDISDEDLEQINALATLHARQRMLSTVTTADIMRTGTDTCVYGDDLETVWELLRRNRDEGVTVIDGFGHVIGIITMADFLQHAESRGDRNPVERLGRLIRRTPETNPAKPEVAGQIMSSPAITVLAADPLDALIPLLASGRIHHVPVVDTRRKLVGMVTHADLLATLFHRDIHTESHP